MGTDMTTHYDTLQVHRKASPEVIQAAYKSLCKKYHPDKGKLEPAQSEEMMKAVNEAYDVLSNPVRRMEYDGWLDAVAREQVYREHGDIKGGGAASYFKFNRPYSAIDPRQQVRGKYHSILLWSVVVLAAIGTLIFIFSPDDADKDTNKFAVKTGQAPSPPAGKPPLQQPVQTWAKAPNNLDWPPESGYLKGYPVLSEGYSRLTVDNTKNDYNVHIKLYRVDEDKAVAVRQVYVIGGGKFAIDKIASGTYEVRYRNLRTGTLSRTERFVLKAVKTKSGIGHSNVTLTLFSDPKGNMPLHPVDAKDFE